MKLVTVAQMRALEQAAVDAGATWAGLMEQAGFGVAREALLLLGNASERQALVLVGPGNNGGDGLVVARHLHDGGVKVVLYLWRREQDDANRQRCRQRQIHEYAAADDPEQKTLRRLLGKADLVVDGLLGIGVRRVVAGELAAIIGCLYENRPHIDPASRPPVTLAIDIASGLDADTGAIHGMAVQADMTVATGAFKRGMLLYPARTLLGELRLAEIGLTPHQLEDIMSEQISAENVRRLLPARPADSHKGTYGRAMVVAGSVYYPGAATLATAGALRVGAGLVTLATGRGALGAPGRAPEVTLRPLPDEGMGILGEEAANELLKHLEGYDVLLVGPGLGREEPTKAFITQLLGLHTPRQRGKIGFHMGGAPDQQAATRPELPPLVIDADGLNHLAEIENWWEHLPAGRAVLTPHPGEMQRLLKSEELPGDSISAAEEAAKTWKQIVVLKGATTVVANPDGRSAVLDGGNAALATAGTGDVLAGAICGLLAQGLAPFEAAVCGVYLHSAAGRILRDDMGDAGTLASDLLTRLPLAIKALR